MSSEVHGQPFSSLVFTLNFFFSLLLSFCSLRLGQALKAIPSTMLNFLRGQAHRGSLFVFIPWYVFWCVCVCVCVCVTMKKRVPDEWQARQATQAILQVSSSNHNAKKITTRCVCLCVCVSVCLSVSLSVCLTACLSVFHMKWYLPVLKFSTLVHISTFWGLLSSCIDCTQNFFLLSFSLHVSRHWSRSRFLHLSTSG